MPITSVTIQNVTPAFNPLNPLPPLTQVDSIQVTYSGDPGPEGGGLSIFAVRVDPNTGVPLDPPEDRALADLSIDPNAANGSFTLTNLSLAGLKDATYRFLAVAYQAADPSEVWSALSPLAYPVDGQDDSLWEPDYGDIYICFLAGTRIATPTGQVAVDALRIGDLVLTADGRAEPILFIGRQTCSTRFAAREESWPVRIRAGTIAEGVPAADLFVSPQHALHIDGVLVVANALLNGTTIAQVAPPEETFTYYNLELTRHEVILAEGAEVESFADNVPRTRFHNHAEFAALFPEGRVVGEMDAPHAKSARQVPAAIRARIAERAALLHEATRTIRAA